MTPELLERFVRAVREDGRYPIEAYEFLHRGLAWTARMVYGEASTTTPRHVSGRQLCEGLRQLAIQTWGALAREVLAGWGIHRTRDFGEMVFLLVRIGLLGKQDDDRIEDFDDVYDFETAFGNYEIPLDRLADEDRHAAPDEPTGLPD